ncbi:MAG: RNA polymerase sigma factor [Candidatus Pacearchaeota archaeon]
MDTEQTLPMRPEASEMVSDLYDRHGLGLYKYALSFTRGNEDDASDLLQGAWLRLIGRTYGPSPVNNESGCLKTYMCHIIRTDWFERLRKEKSAIRSNTLSLDEDLGDTFSLVQILATPTTPCSVESDERREVIAKVLKELPQSYARTMQAYYFDKLTTAEIARAEGLKTEAGVRHRLKVSRDYIRSRLEDPSYT